MNEKIIPSGNWNNAAVLSNTVTEKHNNKKAFPTSCTITEKY